MFGCEYLLPDPEQEFCDWRGSFIWFLDSWGEMSAHDVKILIVDDEEEIRHSISQFLELSEFRTEAFDDARAALPHISREAPLVIVSDIRMPGLDGLEFLSKIIALDSALPVILITGHGDVQMAVEAMRAGAYDFIEKPFDPERLASQVRRAADARALVLDNRQLRLALSDPERLKQVIIGGSKAMNSLRAAILDYAQSNDHVLITGESGTGRSLSARAIHSASAGAKHPMVTINCAAEGEAELEERLFGGKEAHAVFTSPGPLTLILDDVDQLTPRLQAKLTEALDRDDPEEPRIRVIAISAPGAGGRLEDELYFRLSGKALHLPALREISADILAIFAKYFEHFCQEYGHTEHTISAKISALLMTGPWPGNIRQLKKLAEKLALSEDVSHFEEIIRAEFDTKTPAGLLKPSPLKAQVDAFEEMIIHNSLKRNNGSIAAVLDELSLPRRTLNEKMARYGLARGDYV